MGRIIGIDYGTKRIGIAATDPLKLFASPLETVPSGNFFSFMDNYLRTESIDSFVIGYPVQMNNKPSESVKYLNPFIKALRKKYPDKGIFLEDERFTSQMATGILIQGGVKKLNRRDKSLIDKISASIILQSFLDKQNNKIKENK